MIKINLLPVRDKFKEANIRRQIGIGVVAVVAALVVMGLLAITNLAALRFLHNDKRELSQQLEALKREVGDLSKLEKERKDLELRKETILKLTKNMLGTVMALDELTDAKPDAVYFISLEQKNPGAPWEDFTIVLKGIAVDNEIVAQFMRNLEKVTIFSEVDLNYTKSSRLKDVELTFQEFQLSVKVSQAQEPAEKPDAGAKKKG